MRSMIPSLQGLESLKTDSEDSDGPPSFTCSLKTTTDNKQILTFINIHPSHIFQDGTL